MVLTVYSSISRFAGLSDTFTKKLYEWESSREIRPGREFNEFEHGR